MATISLRLNWTGELVPSEENPLPEPGGDEVASAAVVLGDGTDVVVDGGREKVPLWGIVGVPETGADEVIEIVEGR